MRRIVLWAMSTLTVLVLLFSYSTSRSSSAVVAAETRQVTTSSKTSDSTGSTSGSSSASSTDSSGQEPADDTADSGTSSSGTSGSSSSSGSSGASGSTGTSSAATTYAGDAVMTRYGNVQVQITVKDGKITAAEVLQVPWNDRHDQMINSAAVPVYNEETVTAQSAQIDVVSGATYTWDGYTQSLQSAIDQANL
ncbi:FMN-binding protein [Terrabacter sp. LjRoot27]|uniref:FMN-binding protein n=1 Tax=Terrabacter sp. LjRoot27 TaxID=3342306 RepID=UPI003ED1455B